MRYLALLFISLIAISLSAQSIHYGLKVGTTLSKPNERLADNPGFPDFENATIAKLHAGFWANFQLGSSWWLQPELSWIQQAAASKERRDTGDKAHTEFNYLAVPVLLGYELFPGLSLAGGPQVSYLLANRIRNVEEGPKENILLADENNWELGVNLELQYRIQAFRIGVRAQRDLTPFLSLQYTDANGEPISTGNTYHQALHLWVGYALR